MQQTRRLANGIAFLILTTGTISLANAGDFMKADQIKTLVADKTVHAHHVVKDFDFAVYFDADGKTAHRKQNGETTQTTYSFEGDQHCIEWKGKNRCANIRDNGDGTYSRINPKGKEVVKWVKIEGGKHL